MFEKVLRIRLIGLPDDVAAGVEALGQVLDLVEVSEPYPCRGRSRNVRVYVQGRRKSGSPVTGTTVP
ncbi:hypothetical protein [Actinomadura sp. NBRC 104425]|uniref:hypothetical protein n=1 Tax=Actinomadura sp. NBRC 104425 TaxID=3032204 RepID=UPI002553083A|nr:hypothetical protein [Actinomadura sp. NBRC 104425]